MFTLGPLAFTAPWLLLGLIALPVLWILLRAVPPAPIRRRFPGVALLLGLTDAESQSDRTPWWLLLLRLAAVAAVIVGFAGPILNPQATRTGSGPLLIVADGTWADARDWEVRMDRIDALLNDAARTGRTAAVVTLTDLPVDGPDFQSAEVAAQLLPNLTPAAWTPDADALAAFAGTLTGDFDSFWLSDGLARDSRAPLLDALESHGSVTVFQTPRSTVALRPARFEDGNILLSAARTPTGPALTVPVQAIGLDPAGAERVLAAVDMTFAAGENVGEVTLSLPPELRNRVSRFAVAATRSAGAVTLTDDALRRREVALIAGGGDAEGLDLLSPLYYLREALSPTADLIDGTLDDVLLANPDVIVLADVANLSPTEEEGLVQWVEAGGLLLRFAGPRLAASDVGRTTEDPLLPVRLRAGGRSVGGAMSWGEPKSLAAFPEGSPFFGLAIPSDVTVASQVVAQPDPTLADRSIAQLADGTPLVTRKTMGEGQVVLVHVTANAEWSTLPLSGLFVQMLERLAISTRPTAPDAEALEGTVWLPQARLDAFGRLDDATSEAGIAGEVLAQGLAGPDLPPGLYASDDARIAVNVAGPDTVLATAQWPARIPVEGLAVARETPLKGGLLAAALALLMIDVIASLAVGGRLRGPRADVATALLLGLFL
ncbi:MAG: BatA domain-containing protein, partial [Alphaproteobacteria bacterium]|nr:BatA domain-containing protein [Alphaproteobacteria bacterium]